MKADGEPNWAAVGRRIGRSDAIVSGWVKDRKWPDAESMLDTARLLGESTTTWLTKAGFLLDVPPSDLTSAMEVVLRVMGRYSPAQQERFVQLVQCAHDMLHIAEQEEEDDCPEQDVFPSTSASGDIAPPMQMHAVG